MAILQLKWQDVLTFRRATI